MSTVDPKQLMRLNQPAPRYTSYPTAPEWMDISEDVYATALTEAGKEDVPLSLYFHIPFCKSMCLYCGCSVVLNRRPENEELYVNYLLKEIELVSSFFPQKMKVPQLHFGGGTPTQLSMPLFSRLFDAIAKTFTLDLTGEIAIEIDPRTVLSDEGAKLRFLRSLGFNRVSFGVQDTNAKVQEAVKRRQSLEMTQETYYLARSLGFKGINIDLIYGLPYQTIETFRETVSHILEMRPDRIALFSYAKVPWLKQHQKAIREDTLPTHEEKFQIYAEARERFVASGYVAIGMDHFALEKDVITVCFREKKLQRNFQGYSTKLAENALGFGVSSIGFIHQTYIQNQKDLPAYYNALDQSKLPVHRGKVLTEEDLLRKWVIHTLMCDFELDKQIFYERFGIPFNHHFAAVLERIRELEKEGLLLDQPGYIKITPLGELFIRVIAMAFDGYYQSPTSQPKFSQSI